MTRLKQILSALAVLAVGGGVVTFTLLDEEDRPTCAEAQWVAESRGWPGTKAEAKAFVRAACEDPDTCRKADGQHCVRGLLYGPGIGGVLGGELGPGGLPLPGAHVTCTCGQGDDWWPVTVAAGTDPAGVASGKRIDDAFRERGR